LVFVFGALDGRGRELIKGRFGFNIFIMFFILFNMFDGWFFLKKTENATWMNLQPCRFIIRSCDQTTMRNAPNYDEYPSSIRLVA
jgi:hypothetical protein